QNFSRRGYVESGDQANRRRFTRAGCADQRGNCAWRSMERNIVEHHPVAIVAEAYVVKINVTANLVQNHRTLGIVIFAAYAQDFVRALEARQGFGELRTDLHDLHNWCDQKSKKQRVGEEATDSQHS